MPGVWAIIEPTGARPPPEGDLPTSAADKCRPFRPAGAQPVRQCLRLLHPSIEMENIDTSCNMSMHRASDERVAVHAIGTLQYMEGVPAGRR